MRSFLRSLPARRIAAGAGLALAFLVGAAAPTRADSVDDEIKEVKALEKAGAEKEDECVAKMDLLKAGRDLRAYACLKELTASKSDKIACAAVMDVAVTWHDGDFFQWLRARAGDADLAKEKGGRPELFKCVLDAIGTYPPGRVKGALKQLGDVVNRSLTTEPEYAERAIRAYGTVPDRFTVQQLLDWTAAAKKAQGRTENKERVRKVLLETLNKLCGTQIADADDWKKWWDENGRKFKFPEPANPAEPEAAKPAAPPPPPADDPSGLTQYKDAAYGFTVTRPEGDYFRFFKPDYKGPRVGLRCLISDNADNDSARAYISVHDPVQFEPRSVKAFAEWVISKTFKEQLDTETMPEKPSIREATIGGVAWTIVTGKGLALGAKSGWGSMERRFYLTKLGNYILYVDAFVRLSADPEDKAALWNCIESIALPESK